MMHSYDIVQVSDLSTIPLRDFLFLNTPVWDPWDLRDDERYLIELSHFQVVVGDQRLANLLRIQEKELRSWFSKNIIPKDHDNRFPKSVYLVVEIWICLNVITDSNKHRIKNWIFTPYYKVRRPIDALIKALDIQHGYLLKRANIEFVRNYEKFECSVKDCSEGLFEEDELW